jgi:hypothetical protein
MPRVTDARLVAGALRRTLHRQLGDDLAERVEAEAAAHPGFTFEDAEREGPVTTWEYIARDLWLDDGGELVSEEPCPACSALSGRHFVGLAELFKVLPDFNENPACTATNCVCRAMPVWR